MWEDDDDDDEDINGSNTYEVTDRRKADMLATKEYNNRNDKRPCEFTLTIHNIEFPLFCPVLGIMLNYGRKPGGKRSEASPSFDRIDPTRGYTPENTRIISWRANRIKNDGTLDEHLLIAEYMKRHQKS